MAEYEIGRSGGHCSGCGQALAGGVGPLIEVPVLVGLVYVSLWLGRQWYGADKVSQHPIAAVRTPEAG